MLKTVEVSQVEAGMRLDLFLSARLELTRSNAARLIDENCVTPSNAKSYRVQAGETYTIEIPEPKSLDLTPLNLSLDVRYEDSDLLVINKPRGLVVHPAAGHADDTLVNALIAHCGDSLSGINGELRPGIVHRIDKDTSGLLVVAKNDPAHLSLSRQIKDHTANRIYDAVVRGGFQTDSGTIDAPVGRDTRDRKRMTVTDRNSRNAVTHWSVVMRYAGWTHIKCALETGRTHQIRVHMAHIGHPVAGDLLYGGKDTLNVGGQCLHAGELRFDHPRSGERLVITAELPDYFQKVLTKLEKTI